MVNAVEDESPIQWDELPSDELQMINKLLELQFSTNTLCFWLRPSKRDIMMLISISCGRAGLSEQRIKRQTSND